MTSTQAIQTTLALHASHQTGKTNPDATTVSCGDFFAGGGGVTRAMFYMENTEVAWVLNHDITAINTNLFHHRSVKHYWADIFAQDEHELDPVDFVWASIECTQHSKAKGGDDKEMGSYMMGWELVRYLAFLQPLVIGIENVPEFKKWCPLDNEGKPDKERLGEEFERWKKAIIDLGYLYVESINNAADYGLPTRRERFFCFFYRPGLNIQFPETTHSRTRAGGKLPWSACRPHIDLSNEGHSIFGRQFNDALPRHLRKAYCKNTLRRIAGGIRKYYPEFHQFICQYYGTDQQQSTEEPLNTVTTKDRHQLITVEKLQFIQDHCRTDHYHSADDPLSPQLTRQTKQLVNMDAKFISKYYNSNGNPGSNVSSLDEPIGCILTEEKFQFISSYFNSSGRPETQNQSLDIPLNTILTNPNKKSLVTLLNGFDIRARFLTREELAACSTFPRDYFSKPGLKLSSKKAIKLIGNAVPPEWARILIEPQIKAIQIFKQQNQTV